MKQKNAMQFKVPGAKTSKKFLTLEVKDSGTDAVNISGLLNQT
jgi:hypothetical protein